MPMTAVHTQPQRSQRPWGWYETMDQASYGPAQPSNLVKRLCVNPGQRISLQKHAQRAEHWLVVRGTARVTLGQAGGLVEFDLQIGQHCDIAVGQIHRLTNLGSEPVEIIEVQMGAYLGEDDITRLADDFGRIDVADTSYPKI